VRRFGILIVAALPSLAACTVARPPMQETWQRGAPAYVPPAAYPSPAPPIEEVPRLESARRPAMVPPRARRPPLPVQPAYVPPREEAPRVWIDPLPPVDEPKPLVPVDPLPRQPLVSAGSCGAWRLCNFWK
jgi:hypothetical protein